MVKTFREKPVKELEKKFHKRKCSQNVNKRVAQRLYPFSQSMVRKKFSKYFTRFKRMNLGFIKENDGRYTWDQESEGDKKDIKFSTTFDSSFSNYLRNDHSLKRAIDGDKGKIIFCRGLDKI